MGLLIALSVFSLVLFSAWFRYIGDLILIAKPWRDYASDFAGLNRLNFPRVRDRLLRSGPDRPLHAALQHDYQIIDNLLRSQDRTVSCRCEKWVVCVQFLCLSVFAAILRSSSPRLASRAMIRMCDILAHLANLLGELTPIHHNS